MLIKAQPHDVAAYCDSAYSLALDQTKSCYPAYSDGIKTKADFMTAVRKNIEKETSELLLFLLDNTIEGWIGYFWIPEEHYLQLNMCCINRKTQQALSELLELLKGRFAGYALYFGFPEHNSDAVRFLRENEFDCIEEDWNYSFFFEQYELLPAPKNISRTSRENFDDFRLVYHTEEETYWNCDRILEDLDNWIIYTYYHQNAPVGAVSLRGGDGYYEIFGIDIADSLDQKGVCQEDICRALLIAALNHCKHIGADFMTFFCEDIYQKLVQKLGFSCVGKYMCYLKTI